MASSQPTQQSKPKSVWQHLLKVPSKDVMIRLCDQAILYKGLTPDVLPDSIVAEWSSVLSITKGETRQVIVNLSTLLQQAVFACANDPSTVSSTMPGDFHKDLRQLLSSIVIKKFNEWKSSLAASNVTLPRLVNVECRVDNSTDSSSLEMLPSAQTNCILQLKIEDVGKSETRVVDVELSKEKLNTMLDGLSKIRDQLASVTQR